MPPSSRPQDSGSDERLFLERLIASGVTDQQFGCFGLEFFQFCTGADVYSSLKALSSWREHGWLWIKREVRCTRCLEIYPELLSANDPVQDLECPYCCYPEAGLPTVFTPTPEDSYLLFGFTAEAICLIMEMRQGDTPALLPAGLHLERLSEHEALEQLENLCVEAVEQGQAAKIGRIVACMESLGSRDAKARAARIRQRYPE